MRRHFADAETLELRSPGFREPARLRASPALRSSHEGEHDADDHYDHREPYEEVSAAHGGRSDAAEPEKRRDERDDDQDERIVNEVSGHVGGLHELADGSAATEAQREAPVFSSFALGHSTAAFSWDDREVRRAFAPSCVGAAGPHMPFFDRGHFSF